MSNQIFFTPGPAQTFYSFQQHLKNALKDDVPSISHRSDPFKKIFQFTTEKLRELLQVPDGYDILFTSSANEIWERIAQNLIISSSHHFVNGAFSKKFYDFTKAYQIQPTVQEVNPGHSFDLSYPKEAEVIAITQNETSIGYNFPVEEIKEISNKRGNDTLLAIDAVSCMPAVPLDLNLVDSAYFSVQKCFGLPAGLGVWIVNEKCHAKAIQKQAQGKIIGSYHNLPTLKKFADKYQTPETPNVLGIYLLGKVAEDMLYRGAKQIQNDTLYKTTILHQVMEELDWINPFINKSKYRSRTVAVGQLNNVTSSEVIDKMKAKKVVLGNGYGNFKEDHLRIANFPTHSKEQVELLVDLIKGLDI